MPFKSCSPRSTNVSPEPATKSLTVWETSTSEGPAEAPTRAPMFTAVPPSLPSIVSHSPVCSPALASMPSPFTPSTMACAQRIARAGPSNDAKNPSPTVSISVPRNRPSKERTPAWCRSRSCRHARSPSSAAFWVDPTMSVNSTVARTRSSSNRSASTAARNESIECMTGVWSPIQRDPSFPGSWFRSASVARLLALASMAGRQPRSRWKAFNPRSGY